LRRHASGVASAGSGAPRRQRAIRASRSANPRAPSRPRARARRAQPRRPEPPRGSGSCSLDDDAVSAPTGISRSRKRPVLAELDSGRTAEVEVPAPPADQVVAPGLQALELGGVVAALAVDVGAVEVDA